jgi:two-component system, NarL family, invasion response regulator UvrY
MMRIAIADDHAIVRRGLRQILSDDADLTLTGEAASADELFALLRSASHDLVVLDLGLGKRSGLELVRHIKGEFPLLPVLILSRHRADVFAVRALRAGASGYIQKDAAPEALIAAIRRVATGGTYVSPAMAERIARDVVHGVELLPHERLSQREFEVFRHLGAGMSVSDIARVLNLSVKTVSSHRTHIVEKTGLQRNSDMVDYVIGHNLR